MASSKPGPEDRRRVADRLALTARTGFIGRTHEREGFQSALASRNSPTILHVFGAGGVGKTTLLREFARIAAEAGRTVILPVGGYAASMPVGGAHGAMGNARNLYVLASSPLAELKKLLPKAEIEFDGAYTPAESACWRDARML
jgi:hypothetical protein